MTRIQAGSGGEESAWRWFSRALIEGDVSIAHEVFTPGVVLHSAAGRVHGVAAMQAVALELRGLDGREGHLDTSSQGSEIVANLRIRGRHTRPFCGAAPNGEVLELVGILSIRAEGEKLAELWQTCAIRYAGAMSGAEQGPHVAACQSWARRWGLTSREAAVAELAMRGSCDKEIAARLGLATGSVSKYLRRVLEKAGVASRIALAERAGVVRLG